MTNIKNCPVCSGNEYLTNSQHNDRRKGIPGTWNYIECRNCELVFLSPIPTDVELNQYYSKYQSSTKIDSKKGYGSKFPLLRKWYHYFSGDVDPRNFVHVSNGARVLDYGCGDAEYLRDFHFRGIQIYGVELDSNIVEKCCSNGLNVRKIENFEKIPYDDSEFDIIYLMQVFEHLRNPQKFMQELSRVLKPGGILYLAVPNINSIWRKIFRKNWVSGWFTPFHLFHYNHKTLASIGQQFGFTTKEYWSRTPESWFRLNLKAFFHSEEHFLDSRKSWIDMTFMRYTLMLTLRSIELLVRERDCLVIKFEKQ